ncbi:MAG: hypothetical protein Q7V53_02910 [Caldisericota bacterium]|nr:hypothetical protein [Caldisericota bacterium]
MTNPPTLARGASLTAATWEDFRNRLEHDCIGPGVDRHHTADPVFCVQSKAYVYGLEDLYGGTQVACSADGESVHENPLDFYNHALGEEEQALLDQTALDAHGERFADIHLREQWRLLGDLKNVNVTNRAEHWRHVCSHFTREAAEAFIARKGHDYRDGLRIYVEAQPYSWEINAIREAIISGRLVLNDHLPEAQCTMGSGPAHAAASTLKTACRIHTEFMINRYLIANTHGRWDGAEKAQRHIELCKFYVAIFTGVMLDDVLLADEFERVHEATQALTDNMDEVIGFPLESRPDYDRLAPLFFEHFHALAVEALQMAPQAVPGAEPDPAPPAHPTAGRKLAELVAQGYEPCGVMIQRTNADCTVTRGAVSDGGMVIWWHPEHPAVEQDIEVDESLERRAARTGKAEVQ